jgi:hypothetical protein
MSPEAKPRVRRDLAGLLLAGLASFFTASALIPGSPIAGYSPTAPLDVHQTQTLTATGASYLDPATLREVTGASIAVAETITGLGSAGNSSATIWDVYTSTYDRGSQQQLEPSFRTLVFDRTTGELVNCCHENINGNGLVRQSGIAGYVFPVGTRKQTYDVFDSILLAPEPFRYSGTGTVDGITVYRFTESIAAARAGYSQVSFRDPERYSMHLVYSVDPETGQVLDVSQDEDLYLARTITTSPVTHLYQADLRMTPSTVAMLARQDNLARDEIVNVARTRRAFFALAAILAVIAGLLLARRRRDDSAPADAPARHDDPVVAPLPIVSRPGGPLARRQEQDQVDVARERPHGPAQQATAGRVRRLGLVCGEREVVKRGPASAGKHPALVAPGPQQVRHALDRLPSLLDLDEQSRPVPLDGLLRAAQRGKLVPFHVDLHERHIAQAEAVHRDQWHRDGHGVDVLPLQ